MNLTLERASGQECHELHPSGAQIEPNYNGFRVRVRLTVRAQCSVFSAQRMGFRVPGLEFRVGLRVRFCFTLSCGV